MLKKEDWAKVVLKLLKTELLKREMTYQDLREKLAVIGVEETESNLSNKMSRGTFSAIFFLQCLKAMEIENLLLDESFFVESKSKKKK
jgi:ABC-type nitrate/sulfonate/bicarbonate transport system ATPase subunit